MILCHTTPYHATPCHATPHHTMSHHATPHHVTMPNHTTPHLIMSHQHHTMPHHVMSYHTTPCHATLHHVMSHHATPHHVTMPNHTTPHHTLSCHTTPHHSTPHHVTSHHNMSHHTAGHILKKKRSRTVSSAIPQPYIVLSWSSVIKVCTHRPSLNECIWIHRFSVHDKATWLMFLMIGSFGPGRGSTSELTYTHAFQKSRKNCVFLLPPVHWNILFSFLEKDNF